MASYPLQCAIVEPRQGSNEPRPLRIIKRHGSGQGSRGFDGEADAAGADSDGDMSNMIEGTQRLQIFKRRSRRRDVSREEFGNSLAELNSRHGRAWDDAVASCRGLLRRSTPDIRNYRRLLAFGQTSSSHTASSSRLSSADFWQRRASADGGRRHSSSVSSYETNVGGAQAGTAPSRWTPDVALGRQGHEERAQELSPRQISKNTGGYILSPRIVVTAQDEEACGERACVWAAVEISRKLSQTSSAATCLAGEEMQGAKSSGTFVDHKIDRFFDFGCLYDLTAEVHSTQDATIVEVVQEQSWPTTIYAGTSVLLIVQVRLHVTDRGARGHSRCRSEELMEELEARLGDVQTRLLRVKISYLHSAFPNIDKARSGEDGLCQLESRMETTATAVLAPSLSDPVWASWPRTGASQNSLFRLMVQHWGDEKAIDVQRRISDSQMTSRGRGVSPQLCGTDAVVPSCRPVLRSQSGSGSVSGSVSGSSHGAHAQSATESRWKTWSGQGTGARQSAAGEDMIKTPVRDMYYFGERAIKALKTPTGPERDARGSRRLSSNKGAGGVLGSKEGESKFWDWGKWF